MIMVEEEMIMVEVVEETAEMVGNRIDKTVIFITLFKIHVIIIIK